MPKKSAQLGDYYVIKFEKYLELMAEIEKKYNILADLMKENISKHEIKEWDDGPEHSLIEAFVNIVDIRRFLNDNINNVPEEVVKLANENNIKDVMINKNDINIMNALLLASEELESRLEIDHKISLCTH